jgi:hypothetical protein
MAIESGNGHEICQAVQIVPPPGAGEQTDDHQQ